MRTWRRSLDLHLHLLVMVTVCVASCGRPPGLPVQECGNDAIDVSGSSVTLRDIAIRAAHDKGISVGEGSTVQGESIRITDSEIACASKDRSTLTLEGVELSSCRVGFAAFQKKPEFGPGTIDVQGLVIENVERHHLIAPASVLRIDGIVTEDFTDDVEALLYGVEYGTSSEESPTPEPDRQQP